MAHGVEHPLHPRPPDPSERTRVASDGRAKREAGTVRKAKRAGGTDGASARAPAKGAPRGDWALDLDPVDASSHQLDEYARLVERQLALVGEDPGREGLIKTPARVANAMAYLTRGYGMSAEEVIGDAIFEEHHENMVMVRNIELYSMCEHHMLPFFGKAHVAYIPDGRIVGLSKLPRIVDVYARRLQVQERLTEDVADAIVRVLAPRGVGVVIECEHLCMMMRGVEKQNSKTITSALKGVFRDDARTREEFLRLAHGGA